MKHRFAMPTLEFSSVCITARADVETGANETKNQKIGEKT